MNAVNKIFSVIALFIFLSSRAMAAPGATQSEFLKIGLSARAAAMAGAYGAVSDDLGALEYNPAGLALLSNSQVSAMYAQWLADINFGSVAGAHVLPFLGTVGGSLSAISTGTIEGNLRNFEASSYLVRAAWARSLMENVSVGAGLKVMQESIANLSSTGGTVDGGILFVPVHGVTLGAAIMNLGKASAFEDVSDSMPLLMKVAAAFKGMESAYGMVILAADLDYYPAPARLFYPAVGVEYWGGRNFALRAGYARRETDLSAEAAGLAVGLGVRWENLRIDYAYAPFSSLGNTHRVTFNWEIWPLVSLPIPGSNVGEFRNAGAIRTALPAPPSVTADAGERSTLVRWETPEASNIGGYNVYYRKEGAGGWKKYNQEPVDGTALLLNDLDSGARYSFTVRAVDDVKPPRESAPSPTATAIPF